MSRDLLEVSKHPRPTQGRYEHDDVLILGNVGDCASRDGHAEHYHDRVTTVLAQDVGDG